MKFMSTVIALALVACCFLFVSAAPATLDVTHFLRATWDLSLLPELEPGVTCRQASSFDRRSYNQDDWAQWSANGDAGQYESEEGNRGLIADLKGPGCVTRIWSANPLGRMEFYFDGESAPRLALDFAQMLSGEEAPFLAPLVGLHGAGMNSYFPLPYEKSLRIVAVGENGPPRQFYHFQYLTYPPGAQVESLRLPLSPAGQQALDTALGKLAANGEDPKPAHEGQKTRRGTALIKAGQLFGLPSLEGPGVIHSFKLSVTPTTLGTLRQLVLRGYFDTELCLDSPVGDFFGSAPGYNEYRSLPLGMTAEGMYCYWPMPFDQSARLKLLNTSASDVTVSWELITHKLAGGLGNRGLFHAKWRRESPCLTFDYPVLEAQGAGKFLGCALSITSRFRGWFGEGDEKVWVDGEGFPSIFGTGTEDYFGDAWGFRHFEHSYHGNTLGEGPGASNHWSVYRWQIAEPVPYQRDFKITLENYAFGGAGLEYASLACWYAAPNGTDFFKPVPEQQLLAWPRVQPDVTEAERAVRPQGQTGLSYLNDTTLPCALSDRRAISFSREKGQQFIVPVTVKKSASWEVLIYPVGLPTGCRYKLVGATGGAEVDCYSRAPIRQALVSAGTKRLEAGPAQLVFEVTGRDLASRGWQATLDCVQLVRARGDIVLEGEKLALTSWTQGILNPVVQPLFPDGASRVSQNAHLWLMPGQPGASVTLTVPVEKTSRYLVSIAITRAPDYGQVDVYFDGQKLASYDGFADWIETGLVDLGILELTSGDHELKLLVTGKNERSANYMVGLDCVDLHFMPQGTD